MDNEWIKETMRQMVYKAINRYLDNVDITTLIDEDMIDARIRNRMEDYIMDNMEEALDEVIDEIFMDL